MRGGRAARGFSGGLIRGGWTAEGASAGRLSALARRYVSVNDGFVNCGPSGCCVWPVLAPAGGIVRAGAVLRSDAARARGLRSSCGGRAVFTCGVCARWRGGAFVWYYMIVNYGPAGCCVWPGAVPAGGIARGAVLRAVFRADAAGSVAGMDVFSPNSRKVRQPGLPVGESADHRRSRRRTKGRGGRSRRRGRVRFCASISTLLCFPRGVRWGLRAPKPAPRRLVFLDSLHLGRGVGTFHAAKGTQAQRRLDRLAFVLRLSCVPLGMSCVRFTPAVCRLCAKQDGLRDVPFLFRRGSGSPFARSRMSRGYRALLVHFGLARFFMAIPTENERERGGRSRRRGGVRFCVTISALRRFPRGVRWGCAPQTAPRRLVYLDSLHLGRDVGAFYAARGTQVQRRLDRLQ